MQAHEGEARQVVAGEEGLEALVADDGVDACRFDQALRLRRVFGHEVVAHQRRVGSAAACIAAIRPAETEFAAGPRWRSVQASSSSTKAARSGLRSSK